VFLDAVSVRERASEGFMLRFGIFSFHFVFLFWFMFVCKLTLMPNKSPEPMTVGHRSSASRVMLVVPSWLSSEC
jgi:hypothetical protein